MPATALEEPPHQSSGRRRAASDEYGLGDIGTRPSGLWSGLVFHLGLRGWRWTSAVVGVLLLGPPEVPLILLDESGVAAPGRSQWQDAAVRMALGLVEDVLFPFLGSLQDLLA
jgi:hypothetical protein